MALDGESVLSTLAFLVLRGSYDQRNIPFPRDYTTFFEYLPEAAQGLRKDEKEDLYSHLKACLDLSVHVSPLVLLANIPGSNFHLSRVTLIKASVSFRGECIYHSRLTVS